MKANHTVLALGVMVFSGANSTWAADRHVPADYTTIQAAVDAAVSGDTIHIAPGVYVEQTWISQKNLTLVGQPGTILRAFPGMAPGIPGIDEQPCVIHISESSNVTLRGLSFEGDHLADQNAPTLFGVNFDVSGGRVENCRFTGFREKTPGPVGAVAIFFWNAIPNASRYVAEVSHTTIVDCYSGIAILGAPDKISYDVSVTDTTITGVGRTTTEDLLQGLQLGDGTTGLVARNTISGFAYDGPVGAGNHPIPFGILRLSQGFPANTRLLEPMIFEENVLRSNQVHLAFFKADDSVVKGNTFEGNTPLVGDPPVRLGAATGLWISGTDVQVVGNRFRDLEQGIRLAGRLGEDDPFGVTTNATLMDNRFCEVTTQVESESLATSTEQGSLTCPYPDPVMNIAKAVLLTWPKIEEGFVVECAPTPDGPWTTVDAPQYMQDGNHTVTVPIEGGQKYFQLVKP